MDKNKLKIEFDLGLKNAELIYDTVIMTWGVSHYRYAKGSKNNFKSIEGFFKEVMLSPKGLEGSIGTTEPWSIRTNFENFVNGLILKESDESSLNNWLSDSIKEAKEYEKDWKDETEMEIDSIVIPSDHKVVTEIKETNEPRFYINTYTGFLSENKFEYFFFESQFES